MNDRDDVAPFDGATLPPGILAIRAGHGANCSSVGSVVDLLFAASVGAGALLVGVTAALAKIEAGGDARTERAGANEPAPAEPAEPPEPPEPPEGDPDARAG